MECGCDPFAGDLSVIQYELRMEEARRLYLHQQAAAQGLRDEEVEAEG